MPSEADVSQLLVNWGKGDRSALDRLLPLVERELHRLAHSYMRREDPVHTFQTTALISETYLRLVGQRKVEWQNRAHFFGIAAQIMRRILLNYARDRSRQKRGGPAIHVSLSEAMVMPTEKARELVSLNDALNRLEAIDPRKSKVVELRYFGGLSVEEAGEVLKVSPITVMRDWQFAKAWLVAKPKMSANLPQVEELFHLVLAIKPEDRAGYLYRTCEEDDLRQEVDSLISAYESGEHLLDEFAVTLAMRVLGSQSDSTVKHEVRQTSMTPESLAFDRGVRPVMEMVLPEKADVIINFHGDSELQARIEELARKSTEGELTNDERAEYAGYVRANKFLAILKRQAHQISNSQR